MKSSPAGTRAGALPDGFLLAARILVLYPFVFGQLGWIRPNPGVAAIPALDGLGRVPEVLWLVVTALFLGCAIALWFGRSVRVAAGLAGVVLLADPLLNLAEYSNNRLLAGLALVLIGLHHPAMGLWPLRLQLSVMYLGAAANKALDSDWRDGTFVGHWAGDLLDLRVYGAIRDRWAGADSFVGWSTIAVEAGLATLFLVERRTRLAVGVALAFHVGMLAATEGSLSWLFLYVVGGTLVVFLRPTRVWPYLLAVLGFSLLRWSVG